MLETLLYLYVRIEELVNNYENYAACAEALYSTKCGAFSRKLSVQTLHWLTTCESWCSVPVMAKRKLEELTDVSQLDRVDGARRPAWLRNGTPVGLIRVKSYAGGTTHLSKLNVVILEGGMPTGRYLLWPVCLEDEITRREDHYARVQRHRGRVCLRCLGVLGLELGEDPPETHG